MVEQGTLNACVKGSNPFRITMYYKILKNNQDISVGEWIEIECYTTWSTSQGFSNLYKKGQYITTDPRPHLYESNSKIYLVETENVFGEANVFGSFTCEKYRLIRELTNEEMIKLNIYSSGEHFVESGFIVGINNANIFTFSSSKSELRSNVITRLLDAAKFSILPNIESKTMKYTPRGLVLSFLSLSLEKRLEIAKLLDIPVEQPTMDQHQLMTFLLKEAKRKGLLDNMWDLIQSQKA